MCGPAQIHLQLVLAIKPVIIKTEVERKAPSETKILFGN